MRKPPNAICDDTMRPQIQTVARVDPERMGRFLGRAFSACKAEFLLHHGTWKHRGEDHQLVLVDGAKIVGYCGVIPVKCRIAGQPREAVWWVDLVIDPDHRGRGLQTIFDEHIRSMTQLKLGFPNALAAKISCPLRNISSTAKPTLSLLSSATMNLLRVKRD